MLLLIIFVVVTIVCALILCHGPWDVDTDLPGAALGVVMLISGVGAFIRICCLIGIGAERAIEEKIYRALGTEIHGDGTLVNIVIPENMWETLKDTDEINYKQAKVGGPKDPVVAK